mgnify:CR=1 FL=1
MVVPIAERASPRISVNDLARYMVASDSARLGIIRRAKAPSTIPNTRYKDVRATCAHYLTDPIRSAKWLTDGEEMFQQRLADPSLGALKHDDAQKSIEVIAALHRMANVLSQYDFVRAPTQQPKLLISGVEVSVRLDMLVKGMSRGKEVTGGAVLRMTQDDASTDEARARRRDMGHYVATLVKMHIDQHFADEHGSAARLCMSIDVQHGEVFTTPAATTKRINDLEGACMSIAALWERV